MATELERRQQLVLRRILQQEVKQACGRRGGEDADGGVELDWGADQPDLGGQHNRLRAALADAGLRCFRFTRVHPAYYSTTLEERRQVLRAFSCAHLAKTITVENTAWTAELAAAEYPQFMLVLVQYDARFDEQKLKAFTFEANRGAVPKKRICWRLAAAEESARLTGYQTGGVTPVATATVLPLIISHAIAALKPPLVWMGAGDVDLKLCLRTADLRMLHPNAAVVDVTS